MSKKYSPSSAGKDKSPVIHNQRDKIKEEFLIKEFQWTEKQKRFINIGLDKNTKIVICKSPPGTGKTLCSIFCALSKLRDKKIGSIFYIRQPIESATKGIGFVPGLIEDKMNWVIQPLEDQLNQLLLPSMKNYLLKEKRIEGIPIGYLKGRTFDVSTMILDEAEDLNLQELLLTMCRIGKFSTLFIIGDEKQANVKNSGFLKVFNAFDNEEAKTHGIHTFSFDANDCMRNEVIKYVNTVFDKIN